MSRYLFTVLPSKDLGLLTRSLPIARELRNHGHDVAFCHPAEAPRKLIAQAGFENCLPNRPLYQGTIPGGNDDQYFSIQNDVGVRVKLEQTKPFPVPGMAAMPGPAH